MLALAFVAWVVTGLICLADLLERRADRRKSNVVELPQKPASNVIPLDAWRPGSNVRPLPIPRKWGA